MGELNYTPLNWTSGQLVTDAQMDAEIKDPWTTIQSAWTSTWDPASSWTGATTNPALGNGTTSGRYHRVGKTVMWSGRIVMGSTTTYGSGAYSFTMPVAPVATSHILGTAYLGNGTTIIHIGVVYLNGSTVSVRFHGASGAWSPTVPITLANGHGIWMGGTYEAA